MTPDQLIELKSNPVLRGRLAKFFALECFRNSKLEDLHTGKLASFTTSSLQASSALEGQLSYQPEPLPSQGGMYALGEPVGTLFAR